MDWNRGMWWQTECSVVSLLLHSANVLQISLFVLLYGTCVNVLRVVCQSSSQPPLYNICPSRNVMSAWFPLKHVCKLILYNLICSGQGCCCCGSSLLSVTAHWHFARYAFLYSLSRPAQNGDIEQFHKPVISVSQKIRSTTTLLNSSGPPRGGRWGSDAAPCIDSSPALRLR